MACRIILDMSVSFVRRTGEHQGEASEGAGKLKSRTRRGCARSALAASAGARCDDFIRQCFTDNDMFHDSWRGGAASARGWCRPTPIFIASSLSSSVSFIHRLISVYKAGVFFAIFGAIYGMLPVYARTTYEISIAIWPKRSWDFDRLRLRVILYTAGGWAALLLWTGFKTVVLAGIVAPFAGILGCGLWCLAMIWVEWKQLPAVYRMSKWLLARDRHRRDHDDGGWMLRDGAHVVALKVWIQRRIEPATAG